MTNAQKLQIVNLRSSGESYAAIAKALSISDNTVKSYCRRNNLGSAFISKMLQPTADACEKCGAPLTHTPRAKKKRFCSDKCRLAWWAAHPEAVTRKAIYHFTCQTCGNNFTAYGNAKRKYCSRNCASVTRRACHE